MVFQYNDEVQTFGSVNEEGAWQSDNDLATNSGRFKIFYTYYHKALYWLQLVYLTKRTGNPPNNLKGPREALFYKSKSRRIHTMYMTHHPATHLDMLLHECIVLIFIWLVSRCDYVIVGHKFKSIIVLLNWSYWAVTVESRICYCIWTQGGTILKGNPQYSRTFLAYQFSLCLFQVEGWRSWVTKVSSILRYHITKTPSSFHSFACNMFPFHITFKALAMQQGGGDKTEIILY